MAVRLPRSDAPCSACRASLRSAILIRISGWRKAMNPRYALLALSLCILSASSAQAAGENKSLNFLQILTSGVPVPAEWAGVWSTNDTTYDCNTLAIKNTNSPTDTLCVGQEVGAPGNSPFTIDC